ncbi:hypothetical protein [Halocatena marina]|uniref:hypothetical protein n=1 Tax=Halocatena marina TaxID=2934937 RepID=UPI00200CF116|nr:hypothetical protein [Halocatena marina]
MKHSAWADLNAALADASCLYKYPTGEPWNFILPATDSEVNQEIEQFVLGRRPRFELVFDSVAESPVVQFALRTDLSQEDVESLFPRPYGFSPNGLEEIFRIVSVVHPWSGFSISFHLYFGEGEMDWRTGEWLVTEGERISPSTDEQ